MKTISRKEFVYEMSPCARPVAEVAPGETIRFLTEDAYGGIIKTTRDRFPKSFARRSNPATGPVFISGARPGDVLAVEIISVKPIGKATMLMGPTRGPLGWKLPDDEVVKLPIKAGHVHVDGRRIPIAPMVGVIGVAPRGKAIATTWPGEHGGNMDCNVIAAGATLYLPVYVEGALVALGDVHAVQAAGEVAICAAETRGEVILRMGIYENEMVTPAVETKDDFFIIASAKSLDKTERLVLEKVFLFLTEMRGLGAHEAVRLMSLACDIEICQVVDPLKTLRVRIPKRYI